MGLIFTIRLKIVKVSTDGTAAQYLCTDNSIHIDARRTIKEGIAGLQSQSTGETGPGDFM